MKKTIAIVVALMACYFSIAQQNVKTAFTDFTVTNMHTVVTNIAPTNIIAMKVTLVGLQAGGVSNAADVFFGPRTNNSYYRIAPGSVHVIETQPGTAIYLNTWSLRTTSTGDGLYIIYE